jgi:DNA-nicking Smr family endonuclease
VEIDARLDLHGLRETEAFRRLQSFLIDACGRGLRTVLVITGKGRTRRRSDAADEPYTIEEPGVIRRNVPRWLAEPALAAFVVSFAPASVRHGGDGALYLYLRKSRRR